MSGRREVAMALEVVTERRDSRRYVQIGAPEGTSFSETSCLRALLWVFSKPLTVPFSRVGDGCGRSRRSRTCVAR